jgi:flagella basal body P-ring formation protein FlgA
LLPVLATTVALAATAPHAVDAPLVNAAIRAHVADALNIEAHDVEVRSNGLGQPFPCGPTARIEVETFPDETYQRFVRLRVLGEERGTVCADFRVRTELVIWQEVPVAASTTRAGESIRLTTGRVERHRVQGQPVDPLQGPFLALAPLEAGAPVTASRVRTAPDWKSGSTVTLLAGANGLVIKAPGRLLADARNGERVRVANPATGAVVVGVITADGLVKVEGAER